MRMSRCHGIITRWHRQRPEALKRGLEERKAGVTVNVLADVAPRRRRDSPSRHYDARVTSRAIYARGRKTTDGWHKKRAWATRAAGKRAGSGRVYYFTRNPFKFIHSADIYSPTVRSRVARVCTHLKPTFATPPYSNRVYLTRVCSVEKTGENHVCVPCYDINSDKMISASLQVPTRLFYADMRWFIDLSPYSELSPVNKNVSKCALHALGLPFNHFSR